MIGHKVSVLALTQKPLRKHASLQVLLYYKLIM